MVERLKTACASTWFVAGLVVGAPGAPPPPGGGCLGAHAGRQCGSTRSAADAARAGPRGRARDVCADGGLST
eukprot:12563164-Alexandrium_andersonii.AAC.1